MKRLTTAEAIKQGIITPDKQPQTEVNKLLKKAVNKAKAASNKERGETTIQGFVKVLASLGVTNMQPEYKFCNGKKWAIDLYIEHYNVKRRQIVKLAIELEGGIKELENGKVITKGRHVQGKGYRDDMIKYNALTEHGIYLFRVTYQSISTAQTRDSIKKILGIEK